jgi:uncharacterized protein involved in high-affinity Fe2+ transport
MAKRRKIAEVVSNTVPKTKEKSLSQLAQEQEDFNKRNAYIDQRGDISTSDPDPLGRDSAASLEPGSGQKAIPESANFTSRDAKKMNPVYADAAGLGVNQIRRRKDVGNAVYANSNQPTLDNTNAKGLDPKMEKMPTKSAGKVDSKQGSALVGATKKTEENTQAAPEKMDAMPTKEAGTVSPTQGQSLVTAIKPTPEAKVEAAMQNDNTGAVLSNAILNNGTQAAETSTELFEAPQVAKQAEKEAEKEVSALDDTTAKVMMVPYGSVQDDEEYAVGTASPPEQTQTTEVQTSAIPGDGTTVSNVVSTTEPTRPAFDQIATKDQIMNDIAGQYIKGQENVPYAVVEKLGIQDYYPNVGRDIAVGTFSGSRIGSQTIYSGAGALLPMGLYDARKRALKDAAKTKQAEIDKILTVPDTTPQLKEAFSAYALKKKYEDLARNNFDPALYSRDLEARKNDIMLEATAKNLTYATQMAQKLLDGTIPKDGKPGNYMPEDQKKMLRELLTGAMEDPEAFFSGKKNVNDYYKNVRQYADGTVLVNDMIKQWTEHPVELPVNLKTGAALSEADVASINTATNQYLQSVEDGNPDTNSYMTMLKKYYDIDTKVIDDWMDAQGYSKDDPMRDTLKDYLKHQIPDASFIQKVTTNANQNVARARLALERDKFNYQKEQDKESFWGTINASMNDAVNKQTGKTFEQELAALNKRGLDKDELDTEIKKLYNIYSVTPSASITKSKDGSWVVQMPSTNKQAEQISTKDITAPNGKLIRGFDVTIRWKDGERSYMRTRTMSPAEIAKYKASKDKTLYIDGKKLKENDFDGFGASSSGIYTKVIGHEISKGYIDKSTGDFVPLTSDNLADYEASTKVTLQRTIEHPYAKIQTEDAAPGQSKITERILPGQTKGAWINISNADGRILSDEQSGFTIQKAAEAQGPGTTVTASGGGEFASF